MKLAIVVLTWRRIPLLKRTLRYLNGQSYSNFVLHISNGDIEKSKAVDQIVNYFKSNTKLNIVLTHDGNENFTFRRLEIAKIYAEQGYDAIMYIDDDVTFDRQYVYNVVRQYESKSYSSTFVWKFLKPDANYYVDRKRVYDNNHFIKYCGTATSIIDASVFLDKGLYKAPREFYNIEDLWLSYYCDHVLGWKLRYIEVPNVQIGGTDRSALYRAVARQKYTKVHALSDLVKLGWKIHECDDECDACGN